MGALSSGVLHRKYCGKEMLSKGRVERSMRAEFHEEVLLRESAIAMKPSYPVIRTMLGKDLLLCFALCPGRCVIRLFIRLPGTLEGINLI